MFTITWNLTKLVDFSILKDICVTGCDWEAGGGADLALLTIFDEAYGLGVGCALLIVFDEACAWGPNFARFIVFDEACAWSLDFARLAMFHQARGIGTSWTLLISSFSACCD